MDWFLYDTNLLYKRFNHKPEMDREGVHWEEMVNKLFIKITLKQKVSRSKLSEIQRENGTFFKSFLLIEIQQ